ncbi:hypothetical protein AH312_25635 [Salmonella enterica subsp. enterica]|nr:hypothetical protein [Salmonella enterica subsp. enterica serovar Soumbedioune]
MKDRYVFLTVPRAHSRIHRITKFTLKGRTSASNKTDAAKDYTQQCHGFHPQPEARSTRIGGFNDNLS